MAAPLASTLWRSFRVYQVYGASTNVGKTIFSTILCRAATNHNPADNVWYLKPVSTGPYDDADTWHLDRFTRGTSTQNLYQFDAPVSPHLAASTPVRDETLLGQIRTQIRSNAQAGPGFMLVETAGGPNSPTPSGTLQADLYRPLRLPAIFVADWRLGGISSSISSFESLKLRGYDVDGVAVFKDTFYQNYEYFQSYFKKHDIPLLAIQQPPKRSDDHDQSSMSNYYHTAEASSMFHGHHSDVADFSAALLDRHNARLRRLDSMAEQAHRKIWYPFTQHKSLSPASITVIDSAYGDYLQTFQPDNSAAVSDSSTASDLLQPAFDGSASWWTQGVGHANTALTLSAAYAAGRYGHVMFAETIHEPALSLAENLISTINNPRLSKVFYSDNGSTGMEVAVKMALKAACVRYSWDSKDQDVEIIGLQNSYHGDTIGAMDMSEPSVYNNKLAWYKSRGFWFDFPSVKMRKGTWVVEKPASLQGDSDTETAFTSLQAVFDRGRDSTNDAAAYEKYIRETLEHLTQIEKRRFGALIMEPVVLGAGGMVLVDPLFQRTLANVVRRSASLFAPNAPYMRKDPHTTTWTGLPIIADEVFTGLYRLGHKTSSALIHVLPDISVHAKLLTGGLLPLSATLASESIFEAFLADSKEDALLHGHSYTANPVGCSVANTSLKLLRDLEEDGKWDSFKADWKTSRRLSSAVESVVGAVRNAGAKAMGANPAFDGPTPWIWSVWSTAFVSALSHATDRVDGVWALGSVLSITLHDEAGAGYTSNAAREMQQRLRRDVDGEGWSIHSRVLGNVLYLMASQTSDVANVRAWEGRVKEALGL